MAKPLREVKVHIRDGETGAPLGSYRYVASTSAEAVGFAMHHVEDHVELGVPADELPSRYIIRMEVKR